MRKKRIFTIPNLLSLLRLTMIPLMVWLYLEKRDYLWAAAVVVLSGVTDILDGIIARKFDMVSDFGKVLDPVADKLTQAAMLFCLGISVPKLRLLLVILVIKELVTGIMSLVAIRKSGSVEGSEWHGKITTALLYAMIIDHMVPWLFSCLLTACCAGMMILSMILYWKRNWKHIQEGNK